MKPRVLVVPHIYADDIAIREIELARRLTLWFDVFVLKWRDALHVDASSALWRRARQFSVAAGAALRVIDSGTTQEGVTFVGVPVLQPVLLNRVAGPGTALALCQVNNRRTLLKVLRKFKITHLLLANELFGVERVPGVRTFFDVVDWFPEENAAAGRLEKVRANLRAIAANTEGVFVVSEPLSAKLKTDCGIDAITLPNGADVARLRGIDSTEVANLRRRFGLENKFVIGYIGNHGNYTGVDLVVNAFLAAKARLRETVLLIVGPAEPWRELLEANRDADVIAIGGVAPRDVATYFRAIDLGVLAQGITAGTNYAFQIKVVEYTASRKCVVSTPLQTWKRLGWPNVLLAEPAVEAWADALVVARMMRWQPEWDYFVEPYDWSFLARKAAGFMLGAEAALN